MAINPYFNHMADPAEQDVFHDLVIETIQLAGMDVYYIKTNQVNSPDFDRILGDNRFEELKDTYLIEMYPRNFETPYGGADMFSKFGFSMNQTVTFEVAYRRFEEVVGGRPLEGDYIFVPATSQRKMNDIFRIVYVEADSEQWFPLGTITKYAISCERATFAHQSIDSGIPALDNSMPPNANDGGGDPNFDNNIFTELGNMFIDFDESNPFGRPT
jgi:hypothetical protein